MGTVRSPEGRMVVVTDSDRPSTSIALSSRWGKGKAASRSAPA
jgi:hypothetical protein